MADDSYGVDYSKVNELFKEENGGFFVDSFTYTPFIDYSQVDEGGDPKVGVYSDRFLVDYNTGKFEKDYQWSFQKKEQVDENRHPLTEKLFELRNLEKDIHDAKLEFRELIAKTDSKTYIYTFCDRLATLFAKLSNIRMSHVFYGYKHPHSDWEGVLALDVWYNLLYRNIDAEYPFDDGYLNMNPMVKRVVRNAHDGKGDYVQYMGRGKVYRDDMRDNDLEWLGDYGETEQNGSFPTLCVGDLVWD